MITFALILLGLGMGSFVNALVWRVYKQSPESRVERARSGKKREAGSAQHSTQYSILQGRSMCPHCRHRLEAIDLVPILSWLRLRGKCRYCARAISWQYPLVELLTVGLFVASWLYWPYGFDIAGVVRFVGWLAVLPGLVALAVYDLRWYLLPNRIMYPLIGIAAVTAVAAGSGALLLGAAWGWVIGGGIFYLLFQISNGRWIGGGDVKLGAVLGIIVLGPAASLLMIFLSSLLGTLVTVPLLISGRAGRKTHIPFGPFLIAAAIIVQLFGGALLDWYSRSILPPPL
jgi:prepilin signal peptidase PulO-like enzyme (type II secretory pathway)